MKKKRYQRILQVKAHKMHMSEQNKKIRRSVSVLSQQNSKRSSMSILNMQESILNSHNQQQQPSFHGANQIKNQKYQALWEELLPGLKNKLIQSYRVIQKVFKDQHNVKKQVYGFSESELGLVYRNMSNGLKSLKLAIDYAEKVRIELAKKESSVNNFNDSCKMFKSQTQQRQQHELSSQKYLIQQLTRIQSLQCQLQQQREKQNQQIRLMIQNHEEEMMFVEEEQSAKLNAIKKDHQQQVQSIIQAHKKREEEIRNQGLRKVNEMVKVKFQTMKGQQLAKYEQVIKDNEEKQNSYKTLIRKLTEKLTQSRTLSQSLSKQLQNNLQKTKSLVQKLIKPQEPKSDTYLKLLSQKITTLLAQDLLANDDLRQNCQRKLPVTQANPIPATMPYSTMAIEQMFMKSDDSVLEGQNNFQVTLEGLIEQLVWWGFFWEENQDNVSSLFNISRQRSTDDNPNPVDVLSHTLYPLIIQKMKLTLTHLQPALMTQLKDSLTPNPHPTTITQFSTQHFPKLPTQLFAVRYRNIQSIEQLQVSDSMICDENEEKEKMIGVQGGFENHSPIVNYKGYGTLEGENAEGSQSFDVDLF